VRAVDDEDDECGDRENERDAPHVECRIEVGRERARWRGSGEAAEEGGLFVVVGGVDGVTLVVCKQRGTRGGHSDKAIHESGRWGKPKPYGAGGFQLIAKCNWINDLRIVIVGRG
jgi:hypothetical protein